MMEELATNGYDDRDSGIQCVTRIERFLQDERSYAVDTVGNNSERAFFESLYAELFSCLATIRGNVADNHVFPNVPLRLSLSDRTLPWSPTAGLNRPLRVGFLATTGDPVHWGHIHHALKDSAELGLDTVILQVLGDHPHKPLKQPKEFRHAVAREVVQSLYPLVRYTPLGYDDFGIGEQQAMELLLLNSDQPIDLHFLAGWDATEAAVRNIRACNELLAGATTGSRIHHLKVVVYEEAISHIPESVREECCVPRRHPRTPPLVCRGMEISSSLYRAHPDLPLLPRSALDLIRRRNLYASNSGSGDAQHLTEIVLCTFLTPTLHARVASRFENLTMFPSLIPRGPEAAIGLLDGNRVTLLPSAGKETSLLPLCRADSPRVLLGIGLCGTFQSWLRAGDIVLPSVAIRGEGTTSYWVDERFPAVPDMEILFRLRRAAEDLGKRVTTGPLFTTASLEHEWPVAQRLGPKGVLGVEMELALHWTLAMLHKKRAASVYVVSDSIALREDILMTGIAETSALRQGVDAAVSIVSRVVAGLSDEGPGENAIL